MTGLILVNFAEACTRLHETNELRVAWCFRQRVLSVQSSEKLRDVKMKLYFAKLGQETCGEKSLTVEALTIANQAKL